MSLGVDVNESWVPGVLRLGPGAGTRDQECLTGPGGLISSDTSSNTLAPSLTCSCHVGNPALYI